MWPFKTKVIEPVKKGEIREFSSGPAGIGWEQWVTCQICGRESIERLWQSYKLIEPFWATLVSYGEYVKRKMWVCRSHRDEEVAAKIKELA